MFANIASGVFAFCLRSPTGMYRYNTDTTILASCCCCSVELTYLQSQKFLISRPQLSVRRCRHCCRDKWSEGGWIGVDWGQVSEPDARSLLLSLLRCCCFLLVTPCCCCSSLALSLFWFAIQMVRIFVQMGLNMSTLAK